MLKWGFSVSVSAKTRRTENKTIGAKYHQNLKSEARPYMQYLEEKYSGNFLRQSLKDI